ncbi:hypothetical protein ABMY26_06185 [Azospirillum sp. HJ39]|uniref:hypothetical protein n=1 Tax=Azospirillum sp. HJ39 TaxID=3159496 RepID=UPI003558731E
MKSPQLLVALVLMILLVACTNLQPPPPPDIGQYSCLQVPSSFEGPGTIIRRDKSGAFFLAQNLLADPDLRRSVYTAENVQTVAAMRTGADAASLSIGLLKSLVPGFSSNLAAHAQQQWTGSVIYSGIDEHRTYDEPLHEAARNWMRTAAQVPGSEYFLIRDALSAHAMTMELSAEQAANLGLDTVIEKAANARAGVSLSRGATYRLTSEFSSPIFVCITRERVPEAVAVAPPGSFGAPSPGTALGAVEFHRIVDPTPLSVIRLDH